MEYKYFTFTNDGYELKKSKNTFYYIISILGPMAVFAFYYAIVNHVTAGFILAFLFLFIIILYYIGQKRYQIFINQELKIITEKRGRKIQKYSFNEFIGFKENKIRLNLIITQTTLLMCFKDNEKEKYVCLGITIWQRVVNQLTLEAINIMNLSKIDSI